ncbi:hypothetical protein D9758_018086 [Tetrapyrgos nigripes]|uniref:Uncharacterized protein n=1 Tax=Tetrapyrgos nigripes TaxID=182062 RepID=A0A8H5BCI4_9AGAR|nr:hypothetical protein D9758_018086 [Tetrapyrgos nigripes]
MVKGFATINRSCHPSNGFLTYALELTWEEQGVESAILKLGGQPRRYLYVLDVFPSFNGKAPRAEMKEGFLEELWTQLGRPDAWKEVKLLSRRWPDEPGMPGIVSSKYENGTRILTVSAEPDWLYGKMSKTIERMKAARESRRS